MGKYSIGLDLGINNVGWAVYDFENKKSLIKELFVIKLQIQQKIAEILEDLDD